MASKNQQSSKETKDIIEVNGLVIKSDTLYRVSNKLDMDAPDGFIREGTSKIPSEGVGNIITCKYVEINDREGVYDTGFFAGSPCYRGKTDAEQKSIIATLKKHIVKPFEDFYGKPDVLSHLNLDFWDNYTVEIFDGRVFNTNEPKDLLDLYIALRSYDLTPVGQEGNPAFARADYMIKDSDSALSIAKQRALDRMEALTNFGILLKEDPKLASHLLKALDAIRPNVSMEERELKITLTMWLEKAITNPERFLSFYNKLETESGKDEIILLSNVKKLILSRKIRKEGREYLYDSNVIGSDVINIVKNLQKNEELSDIADKIRMSS